MLWEIPSFRQCCTNSAEVNWLPWSECKIRFFGIAFALDNAFSSVRAARELVIKELFSLATTLLSYQSINQSWNNDSAWFHLSVSYMWSRYITHDSAAQVKNSALIDSGKFYELIPDGMQVSLQKRLHFTVPHDTMIITIKCLNLSFSNSAFSRRRRRSSSIISNWDFSSSLFWHSSRYERTQLETVALDMPYSATRLAIVRPSWMCARTTFRLVSSDIRVMYFSPLLTL